MNEDDFILKRLEAVIQNTDIEIPAVLNCDKHLASSALQKSIRRSDCDSAKRAAVTFWRLDRVSFWRRLSIICTEDCGAGVEEVSFTLTAVNNPAWRNRIGDLKVGLYLTALLCASTKLRLADEVISIVANSSELQHERRALVHESNPVLADIVLDKNATIEHRSLALWYLAGTARYPHEGLPDRIGCIDWASEILLAINAPVDLTNACIANLSRSRWPLSLLTPLLVKAVADEPRPLLVRFDKFLPSLSVEGIPIVSVDGFTRIGKATFLELQKEVRDLRHFSAKQIALGVFFTRGFCVDKRLSNDKLDDIRQRGEIADMEAAGLDLPRHMALREMLLRHLSDLEKIQERSLKIYLTKAQQDLFDQRDAL